MSQQATITVSIDGKQVWEAMRAMTPRHTRAQRYDALVTRPTDDERSAFASMAGALNQGDWQGVR